MEFTPIDAIRLIVSRTLKSLWRMCFIAPTPMEVVSPMKLKNRLRSFRNDLPEESIAESVLSATIASPAMIVVMPGNMMIFHSYYNPSKEPLQTTRGLETAF